MLSAGSVVPEPSRRAAIYWRQSLEIPFPARDWERGKRNKGDGHNGDARLHIAPEKKQGLGQIPGFKTNTVQTRFLDL